MPKPKLINKRNFKYYNVDAFRSGLVACLVNLTLTIQDRRVVRVERYIFGIGRYAHTTRN